MTLDHPSRPAIGVTPSDTARLRRRNRRLLVTIVAVLFVATLLCAAYINWFGGTNKPPMKPFHSRVSADATTDDA